MTAEADDVTSKNHITSQQTKCVFDELIPECCF